MMEYAKPFETFAQLRAYSSKGFFPLPSELEVTDDGRMGSYPLKVPQGMVPISFPFFGEMGSGLSPSFAQRRV